MSRLDSLKDHGHEQRVFTSRVVVAAVLMLIATGVVISRLIVLQVVNYEHFQSLAHGNRIRIEPLPPTRGLIFDRNGVLLAENVPAYQLEIIPEQVVDMEDTLLRLKELGLIRSTDEARFRKALKKSQRRFIPVAIRYRLDENEVARFAVQRQHFAGVDIRPRLARHYPLGATAVHAIGYVGSLSAGDLVEFESAGYAGTTHVGKTGVERAYEELLHGEVGHQQVLINAQGRALEPISATPPIPGNDLYLTLDVNLQVAAEKALGERRGAVVVIETQTGNVLTLASTPGYDPNPFGEGLTRRQYRALADNPDKPLFNRALGGQYPPGSTVKPVFALAGLHNGIGNPWEKKFCPGYFSLPGSEHRYRDWKLHGHGLVDLSDSIEQSCDVYFYQLALELGIDEMHSFMSRFGFGRRTGIDINGESAGLMPSRGWKKRNFRNKSDQVWFPGETIITGIGQGFSLATPLQLAHATTVLAGRGSRYQPKLVDAVRDPLSGDITARPIIALPSVEVSDPAHWQHVIDAMVAVVYGRNGTAPFVGLDRDYTVAGKTGTAQVFTVAQDEEYDEAEVRENLRHHGWFIAFAPVESPQIAVAVLVENGGGGSKSAAPVAKHVLDAFFGVGEQFVADQ